MQAFCCDSASHLNSEFVLMVGSHVTTQFTTEHCCYHHQPLPTSHSQPSCTTAKLRLGALLLGGIRGRSN